MSKKLIIIAGICVLENEKIALKVAKELKKIMDKYPVDFYFKGSFDKANRTSIDSFRGLGYEKGMEILEEIKYQTGLKILTDVHTLEQAHNITFESDIDSVQIPAFLCRQTDLVIAIGKTSKIVNIKKGQFIAPEDIKYTIKKVESTGNKKIMITERGTSFGYHNLVVDYRSFIKMKKFGYPVIFDATHSQQEPSKGCQSGGSREYTIPMILGAIATGVDGIFMEVHPNPPKALCDSATSLYLKDIDNLMKKIIIIWKATNEASKN